MNNPDDILASLVVAEVFGNLLLVEPRRQDLLPAVAAAVSSVTVCSAHVEKEDCAELEALGTRAQPVEPSELAAIETQSSLMVMDIPEGESAEEFLDLALSKVADEGFVLLDIEVESKSQMLRIQRILEASLSEVLEDSNWAEGDRFSVAGRRRATGKELVLEVPAEPLPLSVLCYIDDNSQGVDELAVSLLFRQSVFPALVIFLDDSTGEIGALPDDLWGMAAQSPTQPAIIRTAGKGLASALKEGAQHVETEFAIVIEAGQTPSPRWAELMCLGLEAEPDAGLAVGAALQWDATGEELAARTLEIEAFTPQNPMALFLMSAHDLPPSGCAAFRTGLLNEVLSELDPEAGLTHCGELILRALEKTDLINIPLPLLTFLHAGGTADPAMMRALFERNELGRVVDSLGMLPEEDRASVALEIRADAMLEAGAFDEALADYKEALALDPTYPDLRISLLATLRAAGRAIELIENATPWMDEEDPDVRCGLLLAWALHSTSQNNEAADLLARLEAEFPDDARVLLDLLLIGQDETGQQRGERLKTILSAQIPDEEIDRLCL